MFEFANAQNGRRTKRRSRDRRHQSGRGKNISNRPWRLKGLGEIRLFENYIRVDSAIEWSQDNQSRNRL
ncbi:MAG: hypothetical protein ACLRSW_16570 [Christensenellaceae bacterium]